MSTNIHDPEIVDKFDAHRRADMKIRDVQYGFYTVVKEPVELPHCEVCGFDILGPSVKIFGVLMHEECFNANR